MPVSPQLTGTLEDYLRVVAQLAAEKGHARVRDIANAVSVHKSSVTAALRSLSGKGLVNYAPYEVATLTAEGQAAADRIITRHDVIRRFLTDVLFLDPDLAEANACRMEHGLGSKVLERLRLFAEFVRQCPHCGEERLGEFRTHVEVRNRRGRTGRGRKRP